MRGGFDFPEKKKREGGVDVSICTGSGTWVSMVVVFPAPIAV